MNEYGAHLCCPTIIKLVTCHTPMAIRFEPRLDMLPGPQRRLWEELSTLPATFTLYGGTALALQIGHRTSVDFDFFGSKRLDHDVLLRQSLLQRAKVIQSDSDTLTVRVSRGGPVLVSFFAVPALRCLRQPKVASDNGVRVADLLDLAGTKVSVVQRRAAAKDFVDLDALIRSGIDLATALAAGQAIYGRSFNPQVTLKALSYFGDGNLASLPADLKRRMKDAVRGVDLSSLPRIRVQRARARGTRVAR